MALARNGGRTAAQNIITGTASNGSDWVATVTITDQDGAQVTGVSSDEWRLQIRDSIESDTVLKSFTTSNYLSITEGASTTTLNIAIPQAQIADLDGDYIIDVVSKAASNSRLTHRGHGSITVQNAPIEF